MTTIIYTITLQNSDGTTAQASTDPLPYLDIASNKMKDLANYQVEMLKRGHVASMEMMERKPAVSARVFSGKRIGAAGK